jgi:natural product biosynthesis luciferase-like monooxygenase protein
VLGGALATITSHVQLRAGSVVLPLHHPVRVAEEWSVVDNLSGGRVGLAVATGYGPTDFVLAPDAYGDRRAVADRNLALVQRLWRGERVPFTDGVGAVTEVQLHPRPVQPELPVWITCGGGEKDKFAATGAAGHHVLTALFVQTVEELGRRIAAYREARATAGHDPRAGQVTLMLHTFLGDDLAEVRRTVHQPFTDYLRASVEVWAKGFKRLDDVPAERRDDLIAFAFERYFRTSALFGTIASCRPLVDKLAAIGVDEIACLIDFGVAAPLVLDSLGHVVALARACEAA